MFVPTQFSSKVNTDYYKVLLETRLDYIISLNDKKYHEEFINIQEELVKVNQEIESYDRWHD